MSDIEKENVAVDVASKNLDSYEEIHIDPQIEKAAVRKLDYNVLPILCLFYFFAALDRSNIGNAGSAGLTEELGLASSQFSNAVTLFFVTYIISELPATLILKKARPSRLLSIYVIGWAAVCIGMTFVSSYWSLLLCRLLLGVFEGGYFPAITVYVTGIAGYTNDEQGLRVSILLCFAALSGAVGGLISYGFVQVQTPALEGFRFIFLVEGLMTIVCVPVLFFWLPDEITTAKFFTEEEKEVMRLRQKRRDQFQLANKEFDWKLVKLAFLDIRTYYSMTIQFCQDTILYGFSTFLPAILKGGLGYGVLEAQYLTIPVYVVSAISVLGNSILSDRKQLRGPFILATNISGIIGYIILLASSNNPVKYFATYLIAITLYVGPALNIAWTSNNTAPYYRRATAIGCNQTIGNLSGAIAGQVYRSSPYILGHSFSLGCLVVSCVCVVLNTLRLRHMNRQKQAVLAGEIEDPKKERIGDYNLDYVYVY